MENTYALDASAMIHLVMGHSIQADGETFICTEFLTEQISVLDALIHDF